MVTYLPIALSVLIVAAFAMVASPAHAQQGVIDLEETVIKGRIQKPEAFYILQPANLDYEPFKEKPSFIPELIKTVDEAEF
jgi:hypothetical protein